METKTFIDVLEIIATCLTILAVSLGGLWAYTKFIMERGLLPPIEFTIDCNQVGEQKNKLLIELLLHLNNKGSSTLVAKDISARILFIDRENELATFNNPNKPTFGRVNFPNKLAKSIVGDSTDCSSMIPIIPYDTFVQPGVDQIYTYITSVPNTTTFLYVLAQFRYAQSPSTAQKRIIYISRQLGLIHYSLSHINEPHTIERVFKLKTVSEIS